MEFVRAADLVKGAERVLPFLLRDEAFNNLQVSALERVRQAPGTWPDMLLGWVESGAEPLVVASRNATKLILSNAVSLEAIDVVAEVLSRTMADVPGWQGPVEEADHFARAWERLTRTPAQKGAQMRVFQLTDVRSLPRTVGSLVLAAEKDRDLLIGWSQAFLRDADMHADPAEMPAAVDRLLSLGALYVWTHGGPVAMAAAGSMTPNGVRISMVYTPPERRRRGYATSLVAALSQQLLDAGRRFCFLYTDLANPTSNAIYQRIGYRPVGDISEYWAKVTRS